MDSLPLSKATHLNIVQILKKCNDVSFIRAVQSCRGLCEIADRTKPRVTTTAYLAVFVYYDKSLKQVMFDVPYLNQETKNGMVLRPRKRPCNRDKSDREIEDEDFWFDIINKKTDWNYVIEDPPVSQLLFRRSHRPCGFHKKMTAEELGELLQFFRFETLAIDLNDYDDYHPKRIVIAEEIIKIMPYIQANALSMRIADSVELYDRTISRAREQCQAKELRMLYGTWGANDYGLHNLKFDWHSLEALEADCLNEDIAHYYRELVTKWEAGQTNIKYLKLRVSNATGDFQPTFQQGPILLKTGAHRDVDEFHYLPSTVSNRWAITLCCKYARILFFFDISDCDGCDCQTEFCFKKLMEVIGLRTEYKDAIDWGPVLEKWNAKKTKTMQDLGGMIKKLVEKQNPRAQGSGCGRATTTARRSAPCTC